MDIPKPDELKASFLLDKLPYPAPRAVLIAGILAAAEDGTAALKQHLVAQETPLRTYAERAYTWEAKCYNKPRRMEFALEILNDLIGGYGTEGITPENHVYPVAAYVNTGDTYSPTILHDLGEDEFRLTTWGDWYEQWELENPLDEDQEPEEGEETDDAEPTP